MSNWSAKNPYMTQITENFILNGEGSRKETRHIVFALGDSGLDYKVGDALGVIAENPPHRGRIARSPGLGPRSDGDHAQR